MNLSKNSQIYILIALGLLLLITRGQHSLIFNQLPSASWAVFFLLGFYITKKIWFTIFILLAFSIDLYAVTWGGVSNFCVSPAYPFLIPAYGSLWLAGHFYQKYYIFHLKTIPLLLAVSIGGIVFCELFSSGGFYFLSGRFIDTSMTVFFERVVTFFPSYVSSTFFYLSLAMFVHIAFVVVEKYKLNKTRNI